MTEQDWQPSRQKEIFNKVEAFAYSTECTSLDEVKNYSQAKTYNKSVIEFMKKELRDRNATASVLEHHNV